MKLSMFTVHDSKAEAYIQPFFAATTAVAMRSFQTACNDPATDFYRYAADYTLFELGEFDQVLGSFELHPSPKMVTNGVTLKQLAAAAPIETP